MFEKVTTRGEIPPGRVLVVDVNGMPVALFNVEGTLHAIHNECAHASGPLAEGEVVGAVVTCPWHGWTFDVRTGESLSDPPDCVQTFEVKEEGDDILISTEPKTVAPASESERGTK